MFYFLAQMKPRRHGEKGGDIFNEESRKAGNGVRFDAPKPGEGGSLERRRVFAVKNVFAFLAYFAVKNV